MPVHIYWGDDDFALEKAVADLRDRVLNPQWREFNYDKISPEQLDAVIQGLNQVMTPPFGSGGRLVWLVDTTICHHCSEELLAELKHIIPTIPASSVLLLSCRTKPDGRLKSTKLLSSHADTREFSLIPPWQTDLLVKKVHSYSKQVGVKLSPAAALLLAQSVGNDTLLLYNELEKLQLYAQTAAGEIQDKEAVAALVTCSTQNTLQLADAIRQGKVAQSLGLVADLIDRNEPSLRIVATLIAQFRTWLWVKLMIESGERDEKAIAQKAEVGNPKRVHFLKLEVKTLTLNQLTCTLPLLLSLEVELKRGADAISTLLPKIIELCNICQTPSKTL